MRHIFAEGQEAALPLVLLHGSSGGERDLLPLAAEIAPEAPVLALRGAEAWEDGFAFFRRMADRSIDEDNLRTQAGALADFVAGFGLTRRPVAVGFSNGAIMAAALLLLRPGLLAGAVLFRPLAPFTAGAMPALDGVPVLLIDGARDTRRAPADGLRLARRLAEAGADVAHHALETGHAVSAEDRALARGWLGRFGGDQFRQQGVNR